MKTKKLLTLAVALVTIGGMAYVSTQTTLLEGIFGSRTDEDGDGLIGLMEASYGTDPADSDSDDDGLLDGEEVNTYLTDPLDADSDDGGVSDGEEVTAGTDPNGASDDASSSTTSCPAVNIDPDIYSMTVEGEAVPFTVIVAGGSSAKLPTESYMKASLLSFTISLVVETDGSGLIIDSTGRKASSFVIPLADIYTFDFTYKGGADGDTISAYIWGSSDCQDALTLSMAPAEPETILTCMDLNIVPNTYTLPTGETTVDFDIEMEATGSAWTSFASRLMAFTVPETGDVWTGNLVIESSSSSGSFSNNRNGNTGDPIRIAVRGSNDTVEAKYTGARAGDVITAYIEGEETACTDTLTLSAPSTIPTTTDDDDDDDDDHTTTTPDGPKTPEELDEIFSSSDYVCKEPFDDVKESDWFWGNTCRLYQGGTIIGRLANLFVPDGNLTRAEAIKILMLLSGHTEEDAKGDIEHFVDVQKGDWYYPYYVMAEDEDVARTRDSGGFAYPNQPITRGEFMLYMVRAAEQTLYGWDEEDIPFSDLTEKDPETYAIIIGYNTTVKDPNEGNVRVFEGYSNGTSGANLYIKRAEAMALALRFYLAWYTD